MSNIYAIGIGGSGAKCIESLVFLHSLGFFGKARLGVLIVDADSNNGNTQRTLTNLRRSADCQQVLGQGTTPFLSGEFRDYGVWDPLSDTGTRNLDQIFNRPAMPSIAPNLEFLYDALYSPDERQVLLDVGFRGRPPIGSAVMSRLESSDVTTSRNTAWGRLFDDLEADANTAASDNPTVHLFGSVFGGTGASGVPTIGKLIGQQISEYRHRVHLNATPLLPYFSFNKPEDDQQVYAETRSFTLNTQAALQYFQEHAKDVFDTLYLIGNQDSTPYSPSTGGTQQRNDSHFVELFAALSVADGLKQPIKQTQAAYISRGSRDRVVWTDLPGGSSSDSARKLLGKGVRFAYSWLFNFSLELKDAREQGAKQFAKGAPWFLNFYAPGRNKPAVTDESQRSKEDTLDAWTESLLSWAQQIAASNHNQEQILFNLQGIQNNNQKSRSYQEYLGRLIIDGSISESELRRDTIARLKEAIANQNNSQQSGTHSLVHALFEAC
ncbi:hypothetical protein [Synechococcus elongatus]|uniref:Tubulin/FtsZ GTPase domain-containing protein n=1 Tax=Synechococcus elongatus PCC 11802 TaxID=2283154 RepID=A0AAT9K1L7_SYNEL|nr:hypothetical protein [Synechococcus elongatus]QFZ91808.1 hypothetical protein EKO22_04865 [Synechococcus elongatus PCC 11802]